MVIEVKKQGRESDQGLIRRFSKKIRESGVLVLKRKTQYKIRQKSKQLKKKAALRKEELKKEYQKLRKLGQFKRK